MVALFCSQDEKPLGQAQRANTHNHLLWVEIAIGVVFSMPIHVKAERIGLLRRVEGLIDEKGEKEKRKGKGKKFCDLKRKNRFCSVL